MLTDRLAEGLADLAVGERLVERRLRQSHAARGNVDAAELERAERVLEAQSLLAADQPVGRNPIVLEHQLGRVDALVAELLQLAAHRKAVGFFSEEQAHAAVARLRLRIGLHQQRKALAMDAVRDPGLGAVDHIMIARAPCGGADRLQVGAAIGLGERQAAAQLARREPRQEFLLLRLGAEALHRRRHDQMRIEDAGERHPHPRDALDDPGVEHRGKPEPAVRRRNRRAEQTELPHALDHLGGIFVIALELAHVGGNIAFEKTIDAAENDGFMVFDLNLGHCHRREFRRALARPRGLARRRDRPAPAPIAPFGQRARPRPRAQRCCGIFR